jgi:hypothetical protein
MLGVVVVGGIYSPQLPSGCWGKLLAMGAPDSPVRHRTGTVGCPVRHHVTQPLGFGSSWSLAPLSSCGTGQSGAPLTMWLWLCAHCFLCQRLLQSTVGASSRCSAGSPDSPVAHRTVRWIIAERGSVFPRVAGSSSYGHGASDTVRWHTRQSGAPVLSTLNSFALVYFCPYLESFYWFVLNLFAPVELVF